MNVTVIIPVYNEEKYIENALKSLINQQEKPDEVILVDNNCTDNTIKIAQKYKNKLPLKIIKEKKQGIGVARTTGFNNAAGDILIKCDADTIVPKEWIKKIKSLFLQKKEVVALTFPLVFHDFFLAKKSTLIFYVYMQIPRLLLGYYPTMTCYVIRKSVWFKIKNSICIDEKKVHEDIDISLHASKYGKIYLDKNNLISTSGRRIKYQPWSFFIEYTLRFFKMLINHRL